MTKLVLIKLGITSSLTAIVLVYGVSQTAPEQHKSKTPPNKLESAQVWEYNSFIARARAMGLTRDRKQVAWLIDQLKNPPLFALSHHIGRQPYIGHFSTPDFHYKIAILTALGRIGDLQTIREIETFRASLDSVYAELLKPWIDIAMARIRAEAAVPHPRSMPDWRRKLQVFLQAVGLSSYEYVESVLSDPRPLSERSESERHDWHLAAVALNYLADMACRAYASGVAEATQTVEALLSKGNAYSWEYAPALRLRLCRMTPEERVKWLFETIMSHEIVTTMICYEVQAFADEGTVAWAYLQKQLSPKIGDASWLPTLREQRLLGWLLSAFPREWTAEVVEQLKRHSCEEVRQWIIRDVESGYRLGSPDVFASDW